MIEESLRGWYLQTFADGEPLEGKRLREHIVATMAKLQVLRFDP